MFSTEPRKMAHITEELCGTSFAKSAVSDLYAGLDPLVQAWNERDLSGQQYPFVLVDALVLKVREGGRVRALSALFTFDESATLRPHSQALRQCKLLETCWCSAPARTLVYQTPASTMTA